MAYRWWLASIFNFVILLGYSTGSGPPSHGGVTGTTCTPDDKSCEFWLDIEEQLTCMYGKDLMVPCQGKMVR